MVTYRSGVQFGEVIDNYYSLKNYIWEKMPLYKVTPKVLVAFDLLENKEGIQQI